MQRSSAIALLPALQSLGLLVGVDVAWAERYARHCYVHWENLVTGATFYDSRQKIPRKWDFHTISEEFRWSFDYVHERATFLRVLQAVMSDPQVSGQVDGRWVLRLLCDPRAGMVRRTTTSFTRQRRTSKSTPAICLAVFSVST